MRYLRIDLRSLTGDGQLLAEAVQKLAVSGTICVEFSQGERTCQIASKIAFAPTRFIARFML